MNKTTFAAALLAVLPAAASAGTLGSIPVDPDAQATGSIGAGERQAWRLYLDRGKYYAVWGGANADGIDLSVAAAGGKVLARTRITTLAAYDGASFRAPYSGWYTVTVACQGDQAPDCAGDYTLSAGRDCPGDPTTTCGIPVGGTLHDLQMRFAEDDDWFRADLQAGATYAVDVTGSLDTGEVAAVYDGSGARLAWAYCDNAQQPCLTFAAPASGRYYVSVAAQGQPVPTYDLTVSATSSHRRPR